MKLVKVTPKYKWDIFLKLSYDYFQENWPQIYECKSFSEFQSEYQDKLLQRIEQGGRHLFLFQENENFIGLSNLYFNLEDNHKLNIAEFYICPRVRRQSFGNSFLKLLINWAENEGARNLRAEVDKELLGANQFWSSIGKLLPTTSDRNTYDIHLD
jgi:hypothetical protein